MKEEKALLQLASKEIETGLFALRWYPWLRWWRQSERQYWLSLLFDSRRRRREEAAFRILGHIVTLRQETLRTSESPKAASEMRGLEEVCRRVEQLHGEHRDDAIVSYVSASFQALVAARILEGRVVLDCDHPDTSPDRPCDSCCSERALLAVRLLRDGRDAANGYVISVRWVTRDPDLWELRTIVPGEWRALVRRLAWLDGLIEASTPTTPIAAGHIPQEPRDVRKRWWWRWNPSTAPR